MERETCVQTVHSTKKMQYLALKCLASEKLKATSRTWERATRSGL